MNLTFVPHLAPSNRRINHVSVCLHYLYHLRRTGGAGSPSHSLNMRYLEIIENIVNNCGTSKLPEQAKLALLICRLRESLPDILDRYCEGFDGEEALENAQDFTAVVMRLVEVGKVTLTLTMLLHVYPDLNSFRRK